MRKGTRIDLRIGLAPLALFFGGLVLAFVLLCLVLILSARLLGSGTFDVHPIIAVLMMLAFVLLSAGIYVFGRWVSRDDGDFLLRLLLAIFEPEEVDGRAKRGDENTLPG